MRNKQAILALACALFPVLAQAQIATTPTECYRRCGISVPSAARVARHDEKMKSIQARRKDETYPEHAKKLDEEKAAEIERHREEHLKACSKICRFERGA